MALLRNPNFKGQDLVTQWGKLTFDENGEVEVTEDAGRKLGTLKGFSFVSDEEMEENSTEEENAQETENTTSDEAENESGDEEESAEEETSATAYTEEELNEKNVPQLRKIAKDMGLAVPSDAKKKQVIEAILGNQ